jgi:large subunit ribosomal protein L6
MSRIGKNPIAIPEGVTVKIQDSQVVVTGPKGTLQVQLLPGISVVQEDQQLLVTRSSDSRQQRALHGTLRQLIANSVVGVSQGFTKVLEINGVGYQALMDGQRLQLQLGYSHDIVFEPPEGIAIEAKRNVITVSGIDKQLVGEVAAKIRSFRKPEPYKGKGIRYRGEYVRAKQGKTVGG